MTCKVERLGPQGSAPDADERRRIAESLHDGALQDLAAVSIRLATLRNSLSSLEPAQLGKSIDELETLTESAISHLNRTIRSLSGLEGGVSSSGPSGPADLTARLRELADAFRADSSIPCRFSVSADHLRFESAVADVVYRAVSELLTNVEKHAQATQVEIESAVRPDGSIVIGVTDNGVGLPELSWPNLPFDGGGFGLWSIEHRLSELGAFMEIEGEKGLSARIVLPEGLLRDGE